MNPRVSVVIPFYNAEHTLLDAVRSVFAQTYVDWELVLVDDGSTDASLEIAKRISDPRVQVVSDGVNRGLIYRLNQMVGLTRGDYIARMDADDLMHPRRLEAQVQAFAGDAGLDVVATGIVVMNGSFRAVGTRDLQELDMRPLSVLMRGGIVHPSIMARREWFDRFPYREGYVRAEDRELFLRSLPATKFGKLLEPLNFYMESGVQSAAKLLASYRTERRTIREYGPGYVGHMATIWLLLRSWGKSLVVRLLAFGGQLERLVHRRYQNDSSLAGYQAVIDRIRCTPLPGIDA
jgi:glycosyltransferase involved in cell wall biosynthesis